MSTVNDSNGSQTDIGQAPDSTLPVQGQQSVPANLQSHGLLLAQIPDLNPKATPKSLQKSVGGRIISQAMSMKLVFSVGLGLVIGAILFGKPSHPTQPVTELPTWNNSSSTSTATVNTAGSVAPAWSPPSSAAVTMPAQTATTPAPAVLSPQPPQLGQYPPAPPTVPAWSPPPTSPAASGVATMPPAQYNVPNQNVANSNLPAPRADASGVDPRYLQADARNNVVARFNAPRYDSPVNPAPAPANSPAPPANYPRDYRYSDAGVSYPPATGQGSPLMPSGNPRPATNDRYPQESDPGVARFEGTIAAPPARTNYDRAGSSNH
jgi:hypothetical protein